jgi:hypothetical protein
LRTLLQIEPLDLRLLPWELMGRDERFFVHPTSLFMRVQQLDDDATKQLGPIRVLIVEGDRDEKLGTLNEVRAIKRALPGFAGRIEAEFLTEPSEKELKKTYDRIAPHIFHFIGHGTRVPKTKEAALRVFDRSAGNPWLLTRRYILDLLHPTPRVAVLNACRSGEVDDVRALTDAFLSRGAAAVIGMQGDVRGQAAAQFGGELYLALARRELIDKAVTSARSAVYAAVGVAKQERDWFLPSLTLRVRPEQVLPISCAISDQEWSKAESRLKVKRFIDVFVNRVNERHKLARGIDPDSGVDPGRLLVVAGDLETGKSSLLHWIRRRCAFRGRRVKYVDFRVGRTLDLLPALCEIRDTPEDMPSLGKQAARAFDRFNYDLTFLASGRLPVEPIGEVPQVEDPPVPDLLQPGPVALVHRTLESFREALGAATAESPLVLILDHLDGLLKSTFQQLLYPWLIRKVVEDDDIPNLRLVVALSTEQARDYWPTDDQGVGEWIPIDLIPPDDWESLAEDVVLALGKDIRAEHQALIAAFKPKMRNPWKLKELVPVKDFALHV